ncbi:hypothetical protein [Actinomadura parmotrematis]|uniref:Uncharacterized protein n=1 Tax=Actinomadura parmotrematis TaxID=2864039 RepID=A0ABS7FNQ1_9ACTN|nr:hypothetical protein [Actinomadura parmotrematis]MBW8482013.1 hypothetical protein [Actinomadura parmotrematis]
MFTSKKKQRAQEEREAVNKEIMAWLSRAREHRSADATTFTDDVLEKTGPLPLSPQGRYSDDLVNRIAAIEYAKALAERYSRDAVRETPPDYKQHDYWVDLSRWIASHNA